MSNKIQVIITITKITGHLIINMLLSQESNFPET